MHEARAQRRLAAILAADVVGYSRLIRADEEGTISRLRSLRTEVVEPRVARNGGRIVKLMGDGILVEFASAVDAVHAAVDVQQAMARRNRELPDDARIEFRVGINLGDVIVDGDDIHGDGVNMAARLEAICEPGGINISQGVHEQVRDRTAFTFEDTGEHVVKAHDRPIRAWRWSPDGKSTVRVIEDQPTLPDKPSIAVLAFDNMSGDPEQEFFAEGIAEDIITALSRIADFFVSARNSSFTYKGHAVDLQQVGRELGVRYVLEGSVRRAGQRIRVTAQLIDATNGKHIWAEKYDRDLADIFEVQDEITRNVVASTQTQIYIAEGSLFDGIEQPSVPVWGLLARANLLSYRATRDSFAESGRLAEQALALDPGSARAHFLLANSLFHQAWLGQADDPEATLARGRELAERSIRLNDSDEYAHWSVGMLRLMTGEHDRAIASMQRALEINPNCSLAYGSLGTVLNFAGQPERAIENNLIAIRSNPRDPTIFFRYGGLALSYLLTGDPEQGLAWARKAVELRDEWFQPHVTLIACLVALDRTDEARAALRRYRECCPRATIADVDRLPFRRAEHRAMLADAVRSVSDA